MPSLDQVKAAFPEIIYTDTISRQRKLVRYILTGLQQATPSPVAIDYDQMTIEHLAPQSSIGQAGFEESVVGQLGNLLLVSTELNEKLKNKPFKEKKQILAENGFKLPPEMVAASDWGAKEIAKRTEILATRAYQDVWKL
jgi:hypothetical protein